jgi:hypothetical protein
MDGWLDTWTIVRSAITHCVSIVLIAGAFAGSLYLSGLLFPANTIVAWWYKRLDFALAIIVPTFLAVLLLNTLTRFVIDSVRVTWKGAPNDRANLLLA